MRNMVSWGLGFKAALAPHRNETETPMSMKLSMKMTLASLAVAASAVTAQAAPGSAVTVMKDASPTIESPIEAVRWVCRGYGYSRKCVWVRSYAYRPVPLYRPYRVYRPYRAYRRW